MKALTSDRGSFEERRLYALALEARYSSSYFYSPFHELRRNGFAVIERTEPRGTYDPPYHGVARENDTFDWPLGVEDDVLSKALREEERQKWPKYLHDCDALAVVPDWPYILRYVEHCQDLKKIVDVYFLGEKLETFDADLKKADIAPYRAIHMGFDCMGALDLSYIYDDDAYTILEREQEKFRQIEQRLKAKGIRLKRRLRFNEHGLFYTAAEADWYAKLRRAAIYSGVFDFETEDGKGCGLECVPLEKVVRCAKIVLD